MINSSPSGRGQSYANVTYFRILDLEISPQQVASLLVWSTNSPTVSVWVRAGIRQVRGLCLVWSGPYSRILHLCSSWQDFDWHIASRGPSAVEELLVPFVRNICLFHQSMSPPSIWNFVPPTVRPRVKRLSWMCIASRKNSESDRDDTVYGVVQ